jgi:hypothetical protein
MMSFFGTMLRSASERDAQGDSYGDLLERLDKNEAESLPRFENAEDTVVNRARARHIIGIERWGQSRLRTLLGEPLVMDEYDGYQPSPDLTTTELAIEFQRTRAATKAIIQELQEKGVSLSQTAKHNELGDISARAWIAYISNHTGRESRILSGVLSKIMAVLPSSVSMP